MAPPVRRTKSIPNSQREMPPSVVCSHRYRNTGQCPRDRAYPDRPRPSLLEGSGEAVIASNPPPIPELERQSDDEASRAVASRSTIGGRILPVPPAVWAFLKTGPCGTKLAKSPTCDAPISTTKSPYLGSRAPQNLPGLTFTNPNPQNRTTYAPTRKPKSALGSR